MTALDDDLAAMRARLIAAFHDQPLIRHLLTVPQITAAVDVAMATAGLPATLQVVAGAEAIVTALGPTPPAGAVAAVDAYMGYRVPARDYYPTVIP